MFVFLERSSLLGRCRPVGRSGEPGSFLTRILGPPAFRDLCVVKQDRVSKDRGKQMRNPRISKGLLTRWVAWVCVCSLSRPTLLGSHYRSAVLQALTRVRAHSHSGPCKKAAGQVLSFGRSGTLW
jgi:hypothetical protein